MMLIANPAALRRDKEGGERPRVAQTWLAPTGPPAAAPSLRVEHRLHVVAIGNRAWKSNRIDLYTDRANALLCPNRRVQEYEFDWAGAVSGRGEAPAKRRWHLMSLLVPGRRDLELPQQARPPPLATPPMPSRSPPRSLPLHHGPAFARHAPASYGVRGPHWATLAVV